MGAVATDGFTYDALRRLDFYQRWPVFEAAVLRQRLADGLAPERATLLTKANLLSWAQLDGHGFSAWCDLFRSFGWRQQAAVATLALREAGVAAAAVEAMQRVDRTRFVPTAYAPLAFLNLSLPLGEGSNATMFGLGALVAEAVCRLRPQHIIEVGFGSGLMAATLMHACEAIVSYTGFEPNQALQSLWKQGSGGDARLAAVKPVWEAFTCMPAPGNGPPAWPPFVQHLPAPLLLFSCAVPFDTYRALRGLVAGRPGLRCIVPRPLTAREFSEVLRHQPIRWRGRPVESHADYLDVPRAYMVLELLEHVAGQTEAPQASLLCANIQYIAYREEASAQEPEPFDLGALARMLAR